MKLSSFALQQFTRWYRRTSRKESCIITCGNAAILFAAVLSGTMPRCSLAEPHPGEQLSISVTNRDGDVFTNLVVSKILGDGLVLEHKAGQLKVRYAELPQEIREKYRPLAVAAETKEKQDAAANAAYVATQRRAQVEQAKLRAMREIQPARQQPVSMSKLRIEILNQGWGITVLSPGLRELGRQVNAAQFVYRAIAQNGFNLSVFVETPETGHGMTHSDVFNFYWPKASRNPLIDERSIKTETTAEFVKVSYTSLDIPNVNYYFAYKGKWVDVHISKSPARKDDEKLFSDFEQTLSYGE